VCNCVLYYCHRVSTQSQLTNIYHIISWLRAPTNLLPREFKGQIKLRRAIYGNCRSQWPRGLRRRSTAARLLGLWVRISPRAWMSVCVECCVLSGRGLCDGLITRPEKPYRLWCVVVRDLETSKMRRPWPALGRSATGGGGGRYTGTTRLIADLTTFDIVGLLLTISMSTTSDLGLKISYTD